MRELNVFITKKNEYKYRYTHFYLGRCYLHPGVRSQKGYLHWNSHCSYLHLDVQYLALWQTFR